jgi:hypothetical protein
VEWLWTWGGTSFGYRDEKELWTYDGRHVGHFRDDEVYGPDGFYLGELMDGDRLIVDPDKKSKHNEGFNLLPGRQSPRLVFGRKSLRMPDSYHAFPRPDHLPI